MKPVVFSGGHFGWLHEAEGASGVVMCNPLGHEAMWLHQAMRRFADALAARGIPVLRFDYLGTGDSLDGPDLLHPARWVGETLQAIEYFRNVTGVERVSLAGFRFGATIAALAATQVDVDALALFAPVVQMRLYMREMSVLHQTWRQKAQLEAGECLTPAGAFDVLGHRFSDTGLDELRELDLRTISNGRAPAPRILIAHSGLRDNSDALASHYVSQGAAVESIEFDHYTQTLQPAWLTEPPDLAIDGAAKWFAQTLADVAPGAQRRVAAAQMPAQPALVMPGVTEYPVGVGDGRMFGVLSMPSRQAPPASTPVLLIANTSATHHIGDGRFSVELARQLGQLGYATLRIDAGVLGDSAGAIHNRVMGLTPFDTIGADLSDAVDWLTKCGYRHIALFGICAGAYAALRAARANPAVRALVLVNPASFHLPDGCTMVGSTQIPRGSPRAHLRSMWRAGKWAQVLRGEVRLAPVVRTMWRHGVAQLQGAVANYTNDMLCASNFSHEVRGLFRRLDANGVHVRMLFSPRDHSLDELYMHFGVNGQRLRRLSRVRALIFSTMDHEVLDRGSREHVVAICHALLHEAFFTASMGESAAPTLTPAEEAVFTPGAEAANEPYGSNAIRFDSGVASNVWTHGR